MTCVPTANRGSCPFAWSRLPTWWTLFTCILHLHGEGITTSLSEASAGESPTVFIQATTCDRGIPRLFLFSPRICGSWRLWVAVPPRSRTCLWLTGRSSGPSLPTVGYDDRMTPIPQESALGCCFLPCRSLFLLLLVVCPHLPSLIVWLPPSR